MNKKILMGSLVAVVILVLVSFTGVVGYQTTKSYTIARASPLFTVRSSRAIDEENQELVCDYVGKGETTAIYLPKIYKNSESLDILINAIQRMDDNSLRKLANFITYRLHQNDELKQYNVEEIYQSLKLLRDNPDSIKLYTEKEKLPSEYFSCNCPSIETNTQIKCLLFWLAVYTFIILYTIFWIVVIIGEFLTFQRFC